MSIKSKECVMKRGSNELDGILYTIEDIDSINFPFQIYIPNDISNPVDVVLANTTPGTMMNLTYDEALKVLKDEAKIKDDGTIENIHSKFINGINPVVRLLSYDYKNVCIIPRIPRTIGFDSSYLGYKVYHNEFDKAYERIEQGMSKYTKDNMNNFIDLHKQVYKMIEYTFKFLDEKSIAHDEKVIITGYSAASKFSNFFAALHPNVIKMIIAGGTGGNSIIPDKKVDQKYPVGVFDIDFDFESFKNIPQFYYIGDSDYNDLARFKPKFELETDKSLINKYGIYMRDIDGNTIPKRNDGKKGYHDEEINGEIKHITDRIPFDKIDYDLDENGNYQVAYDDGYYTVEQIDYIINNLGDNVQDRFDKIEKIYSNLEINAIFKKYPGNHQTVYDNIELFDDIKSFINNHI